MKSLSWTGVSISQPLICSSPTRKEISQPCCTRPTRYPDSATTRSVFALIYLYLRWKGWIIKDADCTVSPMPLCFPGSVCLLVFHVNRKTSKRMPGKGGARISANDASGPFVPHARRRMAVHRPECVLGGGCQP